MAKLKAIIFTIAVVAMMILYPTTTASAEPPNTAAGKLAEYKQLTTKAEQLNEDLLNARSDLDKKQAQLKRANQDLTTATDTLKQAKQDKQAYQDRVDELIVATERGAQFTSFSALLTGSSPTDFLERAAAIEILSVNKRQVIDKMNAAVKQANDAVLLALDSRNTIQSATKDAKALVKTIKDKRTKLDAKIEKVYAAYNRLSGAEQQTLAGGVDNSIFLAGPGVGGKAAEVAMEQRGDPYVWGATGPDSFDCSGLMLYAYNAAGVSLPRTSRDQYTVGVPVTGDFKQGDLLFYGGSPSTIHHVAMYVGDGLLVHASTFGVPVKTDSAPYGAGADYIGAKRIGG